VARETRSLSARLFLPRVMGDRRRLAPGVHRLPGAVQGRSQGRTWCSGGRSSERRLARLALGRRSACLKRALVVWGLADRLRGPTWRARGAPARPGRGVSARGALRAGGGARGGRAPAG
jgi:hypothetical protein